MLLEVFPSMIVVEEQSPWCAALRGAAQAYKEQSLTPTATRMQRHGLHWLVGSCTSAVTQSKSATVAVVAHFGRKKGSMDSAVGRQLSAAGCRAFLPSAAGALRHMVRLPSKVAAAPEVPSLRHLPDLSL